ncbi:MAG: spore coat protein CotJB [Clostridia bacterium]|nr:spore coat protein CotJB [Clostridia bacterium]MBQ4296886.1 spore coat protein CotJB [Clostridia bacterium]
MNLDASVTKKGLLEALQAVDFAMVETQLYLDAYPDSAEALEYFYRMRDESDRLTAEYEKRYGPVTPMANEGERWKWIDGPWPWEAGGN